MRTITTSWGKIEVWSTYPPKQERSILRVGITATDAGQSFEFTLSLLGQTSTVRTAKSKDATYAWTELDMSDIVRAYSYVAIQITYNDVTETIQTYMGSKLIDPVSLSTFIPKQDFFLELPPKKMIEPAFYPSTSALDVNFCVRAIIPDPETYTAYISIDGGAYTALTQSTIPIKSQGAHTVTYKMVQMAEPRDIVKYAKWKSQVVNMDCNRQYALVSWMSRYGATKTHTFEIEKRKVTATSGYELARLDNSYDVHRGQEYSFTLVIRELCAEDFFYYSDLLTSNNPRITLDGENWADVQVTTNSVTIPDGNAGKPQDFSVDVKYKRYDAI